MAASEPSRLGWGLTLRLARREMRHGFSGFRIFFLCLVLGISTISAVGSLSASMVAGMAAQGQAILGGDMDFRLVHREASEDERAWLDAQGDLSRMATMRAMVRYEQATLLVEAKAVDNIYPLYGELALASGGTLGTALGVFETASGKIYGAVAERDLAAQHRAFLNADNAAGRFHQIGKAVNLIGLNIEKKERRCAVGQVAADLGVDIAIQHGNGRQQRY